MDKSVIGEELVGCKGYYSSYLDKNRNMECPTLIGDVKCKSFAPFPVNNNIINNVDDSLDLVSNISSYVDHNSHQLGHPSKHPSSLLSTRPKSLRSKGVGVSGYVSERVKAFSEKVNVSNDCYSLTQSLDLMSTKSSYSSVQKSSSKTENYSSNSKFTPSSIFSRSDNNRTSYNEKKNSKISMFSSKNNKLKFELLSNENKANCHNKKPKTPKAVPDSEIGVWQTAEDVERKQFEHKYLSHHQSSSSLDLELDQLAILSKNNSTLRKSERTHDKKIGHYLHREFGSQGSIDFIGKIADSNLGSKESSLPKSSKLATDIVDNAVSPKPRAKRLTSKLWGEKDRPSIFRKLRSSHKSDASSCKKSEIIPSKDLSLKDNTVDMTVSPAMHDTDTDTFNNHSKSMSSRATSLLCANSGADTSFSGIYLKVESGDMPLLDSMDMISDSEGVQIFKQKVLPDNLTSSETTDGVIGSKFYNSNKYVVRNNDITEVTNKVYDESITVTGHTSHTGSVPSDNYGMRKCSNVSQLNDQYESQSVISSKNNTTVENPASVFIHLPAFAHFDIYSMSAILTPEYMQELLTTKTYNISTGATAASIAHAKNFTTENGSNKSLDSSSASDTVEDVDTIEKGDGRKNDLIERCVFILNKKILPCMSFLD